MTISAAKTRNDLPRGFTLLEMVVCMLVVSVLITAAVGYIYFSTDERELRSVSEKVELLAKRARTISILQQTPYALKFEEGKVSLMPWAEAFSDEKTTALGREIGGTLADDQTEGNRPARDEIVFPEDVNVLIRRWNSDKWLGTGKNSLHLWRFDPDGLCEPVSIRYEINESWAENTFHPLTATVRETLLEAR